MKKEGYRPQASGKTKTNNKKRKDLKNLFLRSEA
jgi:hypothetical protein